MALGANRQNILAAVVLRGLVPAFIGIALGALAALGLTRLLTTLLVGVAPSDPATFSTMAVLLLLVALVACYIPARRATRTDPMVVLRQE
jgi:ABC-type antimicrobial peptide transport system permease subunit